MAILWCRKELSCPWQLPSVEKGKLPSRCPCAELGVEICCSSGGCSSLRWSFSREYCLYCCGLHQNWQWKHRILQSWYNSQVSGKINLDLIYSPFLSLLCPFPWNKHQTGNFLFYKKMKKCVIAWGVITVQNERSPCCLCPDPATIIALLCAGQIREERATQDWFLRERALRSNISDLSGADSVFTPVPETFE